MFSASLDSTRCEAVAQRCPLLVTLQPGGLKRVTVEICMERQWNIWVSCVSRAPSSCRDTVEEFLTPTEQKVALVCGDFNINLSPVPVWMQLRLFSRLQPLHPSTGRRPVLSEAIMFLPYFTVAAAARTGCQLGAGRNRSSPRTRGRCQCSAGCADEPRGLNSHKSRGLLDVCRPGR